VNAAGGAPSAAAALGTPGEVSSRVLPIVLWIHLVAGLAGACALMAWYWPGSFFDSTTSNVWMALASDFASGEFYRPVMSPSGYGGTRYMPLLFILYGGLLKAGADPIVAGVVLMQASVLALAFAIYGVLRLAGAASHTAVPLAGSVFCTAVYQSYCTDVRPDYLAAAWSIFALWLVLSYGRKPRARYLAGAAAACVAAALTKLTSPLLAAPFAAWLLLTRRHRTAIRFIAGTAAILAAAFAVANRASSGQLLANLRAMATAGMAAADAEAAAGGFARRLVGDPFILAPMLLGVTTFLPNVRSRVDSLPHLYFAVATCVTLAIFMSPGTVSNHLIDLHAASVVLVGVSLTMGNLTIIRLVPPTYALLTALMVAISIPVPGIPSVHRTLSRQGNRGGRRRSTVLAIHDAFLGSGVRYLSLDPVVPLLHGDRPILLDPFAMEVFFHTGHLAAEDFRRRIIDHEFDVVIVRDDESFPTDMDEGTAEVQKGVTNHFSENGSAMTRLLAAEYDVRAVRAPFLILRPRLRHD